jgi:hypothetical protein
MENSPRISGDRHQIQPHNAQGFPAAMRLWLPSSINWRSIFDSRSCGANQKNEERFDRRNGHDQGIASSLALGLLRNHFRIGAAVQGAEMQGMKTGGPGVLTGLSKDFCKTYLSRDWRYNFEMQGRGKPDKDTFFGHRACSTGPGLALYRGM